MALHIVIDGYNLIRRSRRFSADERVDLQAGRQSLVDALAAYKRVKSHDITVVFDGTAASPDLPRRDRLKGIEMHYSRHGELADAVIKRMAAREKEKLLVVSSDMEIAAYAVSKGAAVISAGEFEERLAMAQRMERQGTAEAETSTGWQPGTRKKGPARRMSKRRRKMRQKISKL